MKLSSVEAVEGLWWEMVKVKVTVGIVEKGERALRFEH